ncbi:MAG: PIG-L deacetylase family protein [Longimicrobiales bacterium]
MMALNIARAAGRGLRVLCLGAHADDIEIGCGGTILDLLRQRADVSVHWVVFSAAAVRAEEARRSADQFLRQGRHSTVDLHEFRDGYFPYVGAEIKGVFESLKQSEPPDLVFTHQSHDQHQDHRLISQLTWNTFRDHWILEYEIPKYDGGLTTPNLYVPLAESTRSTKIDLLMESFASQRDKPWFTPETFLGLSRLRGLECASPTGYAEGFHLRKATLDWRGLTGQS